MSEERSIVGALSAPLLSMLATLLPMLLIGTRCWLRARLSMALPILPTLLAAALAASQDQRFPPLLAASFR